MRSSNLSWTLALGATIALAGCGTGDTRADNETTPAPVVSSTTESTAPGDVNSTTTSTAPKTTTSAIAEQSEAVPLSSVVGGSIRGDGWHVEPGRYFAPLGDRVFTFTIEEPVVYFESDVRITFGPDTSSQVTDRFFLTEFIGVIPPDRTSQHAPHDPVVPSYTAPIPSDLGTWLSSVPQISAGVALELSTGTGINGHAWDIQLDSSDGGTFHCPFGDCIGSLVQETEGVWVLFEDARFRLWQLTGEADGVFGFLQSRPETFSDMTAWADAIFVSMQLAPAE